MAGIIRFVSFQEDEETGARSITDIIEWGPAKDEKTTRRMLMRQFGRMVDQMLRGDDDVAAISVERMN